MSPPARGLEPKLDLLDVSDRHQLRSYAATAQVVYMGAGIGGVPRLSQNEIASRMPPSPWGRRKAREGVRAPDSRNAVRRRDSGNFSRQLHHPSDDFLKRLDTVILTAAPQMSRAGGLAAFGARLEGVHDTYNVEAEVSPLWTPWLLEEDQPRQQIILLLQATALLSAYEKAGSLHPQVENIHQGALHRVLDRLILIGGLPPTPYNVDAMILLGSISRFGLDLVRERLHEALRTPLGFRVWRAITAIVLSTEKRGEIDTEPGWAVRDWVKEQLAFCEELRKHSLYPARSLDLELAISVPTLWSPPLSGEDWAGDVLRRRAANREATLRERGTALFGLWERAIKGSYIHEGKQELRNLLHELQAETHDRPGLAWITKTLEECMRQNRAVLTIWPDWNEPCQKVARDAATHLDRIPERIREATKTLFEHSVTSNAGVYRRRSIDALRAGGWAGYAVPGLRAIMAHDDAEPWLHCRALFTLGYLQERGELARDVLHTACTKSWDFLKTQGIDDSPRSRVGVTELHAALFAVGDCFGDPAASQEAEHLRARPEGGGGSTSSASRSFDDLLQELVDRTKEDGGRLFVPIGRAVAYLVAVTAHIRPIRSRKLLGELREVADPATKQMCEWGLRRLADQNNVRPAHDVQLEPIDLDR